MSISIKLGKETEKMLELQAKRHGMKVSDYVRMLLEQNLSGSSVKLSSKLWRKGVFPELLTVSEEDFKRAQWQPKNIES